MTSDLALTAENLIKQQKPAYEITKNMVFTFFWLFNKPYNSHLDYLLKKKKKCPCVFYFFLFFVCVPHFPSVE